MKLIDESNNTYEVNERELHDMFANAFNDAHAGAHILSIKLTPEHPELISNEEQLRVLMLRVNAVLQAVNEIDCTIHDVAEHACECAHMASFTTDARTSYHHALDVLLDAADADGQLIDAGDITLTFNTAEEKPTGDLNEVLDVFHAEIAASEIEEAFIKRVHFVNGEPKPELDVQLPIDTGS